MSELTLSRNAAQALQLAEGGLVPVAASFAPQLHAALGASEAA